MGGGTYRLKMNNKEAAKKVFSLHMREAEGCTRPISVSNVEQQFSVLEIFDVIHEKLLARENVDSYQPTSESRVTREVKCTQESDNDGHQNEETRQTGEQNRSGRQNEIVGGGLEVGPSLHRLLLVMLKLHSLQDSQSRIWLHHPPRRVGCTTRFVPVMTSMGEVKVQIQGRARVVPKGKVVPAHLARGIIPLVVVERGMVPRTRARREVMGGAGVNH
jgi:hypothetical protein